MSKSGFSKWIAAHRLIRNIIAFLTILCFSINPLAPLFTSTAIAQGIVTDQNAAAQKQATVGQTGNGTTQVDIVTPDGTGLSHNIFQTYNVGTGGVVLNNSATGGQSQIGGEVAGNANLTAGNEARIILNEVTGAGRSQLLGATEVFGAQAHVILANPYGITCNGCGFINTPRATLSTGKPVFDANGSFIGLDVESHDVDGNLYVDENGKRSDVRIEGVGADVAGLHYFDIIARAIYIGAEIRGSADSNNGKGTEIGLFAGLNRFHYNSRTITKLQDGDGTGGGIEIDSVLLGGAYANQITLLSTEKGVGINAPEVQSAMGGIRLSADGKITIGKARAKKDIRVKSASSNIRVQDYVITETALEFEAAGSIDLDANARVTSLGNSTVRAASVNLGDGSVLGAGMDENGNLVADGLLTIEAATLANRGTISAHKGIEITVSNRTDNHGIILSENTLSLIGGGVFHNHVDAMFSGNAVTGDLAGLTNDGFIQSTGGSIVASVLGTASNTGTISSVGSASFDVAGDLNNSGTISATGPLSVANAAINNSGSISSQGNITFNNVAGLANSGQLISESGDLTGNITGDIDNSGTINAAGNIELDVAGNVTNQIESTIVAGATLQIKARTLDNLGDFPNGVTGGLLSGQNVDLQVDTLNNLGDIKAGNNIAINAESAVFNIFGAIEAGNRVDITAVERIENLSGLITGKNVNLKAKVVTNIDVVQRDEEILLPETLQEDLTKKASVLVDKALETYREQMKPIDEKALEGLRERLMKTAEGVIKNASGSDISNRQAVLDRIGDALIGDLEKHAAAQKPSENQEAGSASFFRKDIKAKLDETKASFTEEKPGNDGLKRLLGQFGDAGTSGNYEDTVVRKAEISASENVNIKAGEDFTAIGGKVEAGKNINLSSGGTITITAQQLETVNNRRFKGGHENEYTLISEQAEFKAGKDINIAANSDIDIAAAKIEAGNNVKVRSKEGEIRLSSVVDKRNYDYYKKKKSGILNHKKKKTVKKANDEVNILTTITAGGAVLVTTDDKNVVVRGTEIEAQKNIHLRSGKQHVLLEAVADKHDYVNYTSTSKYFGLNKKSKKEEGEDITHQPTFVSAKGNVILDSAAGNLIINGSIVEAGQNIRINAQNVYINAVHDYHFRRVTEKQSGFFFETFSGDGSAGHFFGYKSEKHVITDKARLAQVSSLFADGSIVMDIKNDFTSEAASIIARNNLVIHAGGNIAFNVAYDTITHDESHKQFQIGITQTVQENITSTIDTLKDVPDQWNAGAGSEANRVITRASTALRAIDAVNTIFNGSLVSAGVSFGFSSSKARSNATQNNAQVGVVQAGNDVIITSAADLTFEGTQVEAGRNLVAEAAGDLRIQSALNSYSENSKSSQFGASVGINVGVGLTGVNVSASASANFNKAKSNASGTTHTHAVLSAGNQIKLKSGNDTLVRGGIVAAHSIIADVGGNLNVESVQDTYRMRSRNIGFGVSLSVGLGGVPINGQTISNPGTAFSSLSNNVSSSLANLYSGSADKMQKTAGINISYGKGKADAAWTNTLSGFYSEDTLSIRTEGNTHLKGAVIHSASGRESLDTGTFTWEDIKDYERSENYQFALSTSFSFGGDPNQQKKPEANTALKRFTDALPPFKVEGTYEKTDKEGITRATFGTGKIAIRDTEKQKQLEASGKTKNVAALNRDVEAVQEVTKNEREYVGVYVSDTSVKAVGAAVEFIHEQVRRGLISGDKAKEAEEFVRRIKEKKVAQESLGPCNTGQRQGWLHNLLFKPAYAAKGDDCILLTIGRDGLYKDNGERISEEAHTAARMGVISASMTGIKEAANGIIALEAKGTLTQSEQMQLAAYKADLQFHMNRYELCWDNSFSSAFGGIMNMSDFMAREGFKIDNKQFYRNAEDFARGGAEFTERMKSFADLDDPEVQKLRNSNPRLYAALMNVEHREGVENIVDVAFQLNGLALAGYMPEEDRRHTINHIIQQIKSFDHIGDQDYGRPMRANAVIATQANAILSAVEGLDPGDKRYFLNALVSDELLWQKREGQELAYRKQRLRAQGEFIRRAVDDYARSQGWCDGSRCSDKALEKARGDLTAQYLRQTSDLWKIELKDGYEFNGSAAQFLANIAYNVGKLDANTDYIEMRFSGQHFDERFQNGRSLFTATELEKKYNHVLNAFSTYENRDLYNSMVSPTYYGLHHDWSYTSYANALNGSLTDFRLLNRAEVLDLFATASYEAALQSKFYWDHRNSGRANNQETEYHRSAGGSILSFIQKRVISARNSGQLKFSEINLYSYYGANKDTEHPGLAVARNAHAMNLLAFDIALAGSGVPKRIPGMKPRNIYKDAPPIPGGNKGPKGLLSPSQKTVVLLPKPKVKGVATQKIYIDHQGNAYVGKLPPNGGYTTILLMRPSGTLLAHKSQGSVVRNELDNAEYKFARDIVAYQGGKFVGPPTDNFAGIDGWLNKKPISLKETQSGNVNAIVREARRARTSAHNANYSKVDTYIKAPNITINEILYYKHNQNLLSIPKGTISSIVIFAKDGVLVIPRTSITRTKGVK